MRTIRRCDRTVASTPMSGLQPQLNAQHAASTRGGQDCCVDLTGASQSESESGWDSDCRIVADPRPKQQQQQQQHQQQQADRHDTDDDDVIIMDSMPGPQHSLGRKAQLGSGGQHNGAQGSQSCTAAAAALTGGSPAMGTATASQGQPPQNLSGPVGADPADSTQQPLKKQRIGVGSSQELPEPQQQQQQQQLHQPSAPSSGSQPLSGHVLSRQQRLTQALSQSRAGSAGTIGAASTAATNAQPRTVDAVAASESSLQAQAQAAAARPAVKQGRKQAASRLGSARMPPVLLPPAQHPVPKHPAASAPVRPAAAAAAMPAIRTHVTPAAAAPTALAPAPEQPELQPPAAKVSKTSPVWSDSRRAAAAQAHAEAHPQRLTNNNDGTGIDAGG